MLRVIPAINCHLHDRACAERKLRTAEAFAERVHLDIADGVFTFGTSWGSPEEWKALSPKVATEVHLMVEHPEKVAEAWLSAGAKRIIVHYEAFPRTKGNPERLRVQALEHILKLCREYGAEAMLAVNPETNLAHLPHHLARFRAFMVFSQATPGPSGQKFLTSVLPKIRALRAQYPDATIEVDGGIDAETARLAKDAGADTVVSGSYTLDADDPRARYEFLRTI